MDQRPEIKARSRGQGYELYELREEKCACAYNHLTDWMDTYKRMQNRPLLPSDPAFPDTNEACTEESFGERIVHATFIKTLTSMSQRVALYLKILLVRISGNLRRTAFEEQVLRIHSSRGSTDGRWMY